MDMKQSMIPSRSSRLLLYGCFLLACLLCAYLVLSAINARSDFSAERLYWEYAGRVLGTAWTPGFPEWVQFRDGPLPASIAQSVTGDAQAPYSDFVVEYPPGALLYFVGLRLVFDDYAYFSAAHNILMALAFTGSIAVALTSLRRALGGTSPSRVLFCGTLAALACPVMVYLIGGFIISRFDALTAVLAAAAIASAQRRFAGSAGMLLGLAGAIKLWPLFLLPFLSGDSRAFLRATVCAMGAFAACHLVFLSFGTAPGDLLGYLNYAFDRPLHSESLPATVHFLTHGPTDLNFSYGSWGLPQEAGPAWAGWTQNAYVLLIGGCALFRLLKQPGTFSGGTAATVRQQALLQLGAIALLLCAARVFSGEYMIWIAPLAIAAAASAFGLPLLLALIAMAGVKLGYIQSQEASVVGQAEIAAFALKWAALSGLVVLACGSGLRGRQRHMAG